MPLLLQEACDIGGALFAQFLISRSASRGRGITLDLDHVTIDGFSLVRQRLKRRVVLRVSKPSGAPIVTIWVRGVRSPHSKCRRAYQPPATQHVVQERPKN